MREEGVERGGHDAHGVLVEGDPVDHPGADVADAVHPRRLDVRGDDQRAADDVRVPADVLGRRVHDDVGTERERVLQVGRGERVVDDEQRAGGVRQVRELADVGDGEHRVGRRLDPDGLRLPGPDRGAHGVEVGQVDLGVVDAPRAGDARDEPVGAAVRVVGHDDVVAGAEHGAQHDVLGAEARGEGEGASGGPFERGEALLERGAGRVGAAAVLVAGAETGAQPADAVLLVRRRRVDRRDHRAAGRRGVRPGVDGAGREAAAPPLAGGARADTGVLVEVADGRIGGRPLVGRC